VAEQGELAEESFLTVAEVAGMLKLNQQTVRNWIDQGTLRALRVGRRVRIKRSDLERMLEEGYQSGGAAASQPAGPSAEDFWGGEPVGIAEPAPASVDGGLERRPERLERAERLEQGIPPDDAASA
jgi:excisionase family DNA binding protein